MARARQAHLVQSKLAVILFGDKFTGKSTLASQLAYFKNPDGSPFKVLYLDPESGSIDDYLDILLENGVRPEDLYIVYTQSLEEVREYIRKAKDGEDFYDLDENGEETETVIKDSSGNPFRPDAIVVDGASVLNLTTKHGLVQNSRKRAAVKAKAANLVGDERFVKVESAGLELKDYQTINFKGQQLILDLNGCGKHYIVTAREADEMVTKLDQFGKEVRVATGKKIPEGFKEMDYNAKTVIWMHRDEEDYDVVKAFIQKDRTGVHTAGEDIEDPTLLDWQSVIDKTAKHKEFVIRNNMHEAIKTEEKFYSKEFGTFVDEEPETKPSEPVSDAAIVIQRIDSLLAGKSPVQKKKAKDACGEKDLPVGNYRKLTDAKVLASIEAEIKKALAE